MPPLPDLLQPLAILNTANRKASDYYAPLLASDDELLRVGAWCALLERGEVDYAQYPAVIALCGHAGIRRRAYQHFMQFYEYGWAEKAAAVDTASEEATEQAVMQADLGSDEAARIAALRAHYLATGKIEALGNLVKAAEAAGGWRRALPIIIDAVAINPHDPMAMLDLMNLLHQSQKPELIDAVLGLLEANRLHPHVGMLYSAASRLMKGNPGGCLKLLGQLSTARISRPDVSARMRFAMLGFSGEALEKLGDYQKAYASYRELNGLDHGKQIDLEEFPRMVRSVADLAVPAELPVDPRTGYHVMTGFPRSGTTLLENAFAAHPLIETFEEIPASSSMYIYLDRVLPELPPDADRTPTFLAARERYYVEMDRLRRKSGATAFIDKMPMRSAEAAFLSRLFPNKRYVFSIRHPFDVVLSCFKQQFKPNVAMEHFRTFENAVKLYDFTMQQWFGAFSMDDPRVHYVRYDTLVTDFEPTIRGALDFLGLPWDDAVLGFAKAAESRSTRTPSYTKVRQGLSIGVQSSWRNYGFLFQQEMARPLFRWAEFFGYPAK